MLGAYGYALDVRTPWLQDIGASGRPLHLEQRPGAPPEELHWTTDSFCLRTATGGWVSRRGDEAIGWTGQPDVDDSELVHPRLSTVAAVSSGWFGQLSLHGAAVLTDAGAIALLGAREAGKSSTVAHLSEQGYGVVADDIVLLEDGQVHAGPRAVDRRAPPGEPVRRGTRWRTTLDPVPPRVPLAGVVLLAWGDTLREEPVSLVERSTLWREHAMAGAAPPDQLMALLTVPWRRLVRPPQPELIADCAARVAGAARST